MAHARWSAETGWTRRTGLSVNPQFTTDHPRNSVQTTAATAGYVRGYWRIRSALTGKNVAPPTRTQKYLNAERELRAAVGQIAKLT
jgi:hypothetical protein